MQSFQYDCIVAQDGVRAAGTAHAGKAGYANARYDVIRLEGLSGHKITRCINIRIQVWQIKSTKWKWIRHGLSKEVE